MSQKRVLLIVGGGIAACKAPELVRTLDRMGIASRVILTSAGAQFVTPLTLASFSRDEVYSELFDLTAEARMGHIELSRSADLVVVAPATADLMAKLAHGLANDLASTALLATDKPVLMAPSMNVRMWHHPATQRNLATLKADGVMFVGPDEGAMACGEYGLGRMAEPDAIAREVEAFFARDTAKPLAGKRALVTAGPTLEALDPVRFISNRSSGKQGYAIAQALASAGADVTLVSGPTALDNPVGVRTVRVESALQMLSACLKALPCDVFVAVAAVADWRAPDVATDKLKLKGEHHTGVQLDLVENPDILATLAQDGPGRPGLVIGFAAETRDVISYAKAKRVRKACDWIVANDVSGDVMGGDANEVHLVTEDGVETWARAQKHEVATRLVDRIAQALKDQTSSG
jgi:phosphopantothenoylcysteine decarboxylase / phosphopantothenate---cysteine ligase